MTAGESDERIDIPPHFSPGASNALSNMTNYKGAAKLHRGVVSIHERWLLSLISHLMDRSRFYPLPNIRYDGIAKFMNQKLGQLNNWGGAGVGHTPDGTQNPVMGETSAQYGWNSGAGLVNDDSSLSGRYAIYNGRVNSPYTTTVAANSSKNLWVVFSPQMRSYPIAVIDMTTQGTPAVDNPSAVAWLCDPYSTVTCVQGTSPVLADDVSVVSSVSQRSYLNGGPIRKPNSVSAIPAIPSGSNSSVDHLVYPGGYEMMVSAINLTAYTSCSMRVRNEINTIHTFLTNMTYALGSTTINPGITDPYVKCDQATACYSGNQWESCTEQSTPVANPPVGYELMCAFQAVQNGYPFFDIQIQNSGSSSASVTFNFVVNGWSAVAPLNISAAGALSLETVPFNMPGWFTLGRSASAVGPPAAYKKQLQKVSSRAVSFMPLN